MEVISEGAAVRLLPSDTVWQPLPRYSTFTSSFSSVCWYQAYSAGTETVASLPSSFCPHALDENLENSLKLVQGFDYLLHVKEGTLLKPSHTQGPSPNNKAEMTFRCHKHFRPLQKI